MKDKKLWALAGIALSYNLLLTTCYSNLSSKSRDKVTAKQGVKKKHQMMVFYSQVNHRLRLKQVTV